MAAVTKDLRHINMRGAPVAVPAGEAEIIGIRCAMITESKAGLIDDADKHSSPDKLGCADGDHCMIARLIGVAVSGYCQLCIGTARFVITCGVRKSSDVLCAVEDGDIVTAYGKLQQEIHRHEHPQQMFLRQ